MKFKFKIQPYQTDAVENTAAVFSGQPFFDNEFYRRDLGKRKETIQFKVDDSGYRNHEIELSSEQLLKNIRTVQAVNEIIPSESLVSDLGKVMLDIEMETGTGKTYVYIKTMFELNKRYGWSKFIVVVPSIAIREGVAKSFQMLEEHFMEHYGKKARCIIYNSSNLHEIDTFSANSGLNVMIINTQAFAASLKEGGRSKESRIIYTEGDKFASRRPIDVISANHPILIMDEPQKMGPATVTALKNFKPLFVLYYSATHRTRHNTIYALDALDAFKQKLVKKIYVKGFEIKNLQGTSGYLYIDNILLSPKRPPQVKIELEVKLQSGEIRRKSKVFDVGDNLYHESGLHQYDGFVITDINPYNNSVTFMNGEVIKKGEVVGDVTEEMMKRVQIRETIASHFEKEQQLFERGIKTLSLFFIDEVAKYKSYDDDGNEVKGVFQRIFEEEYNLILNEKISLFSDAYQQYLRRFEVSKIHNGYFSIDKKTGRSVNSETGRKSDTSDDISAYDLILKNKERLLSFEEPTRFIFSHSALREGWDNPNVFQICTLRHASSSTAKRQEVGRGLRLCVDRYGNRMDYETLGDDIHEINKLTVIANESYSAFTDALQKETSEVLRERAVKATNDYFKGKTIIVDGDKHTITDTEASRILIYLEDNGYIDEYSNLTKKYREDKANNSLASMPEKLQPIAEGVVKLIDSIYDPSVLNDMVGDDNKSEVENLGLNENFKKKEFQELWEQINHQYVYTVHYNSDELIKKAIDSIDKNLFVTQLKYIKVEGEQQQVDSFGNTRTATKTITAVSNSKVKYDLVGEIARGATLTRKTVVEILKGINEIKLLMFKYNPEEFIRKVIRLIKAEKASMIVEHISYNMIEDKYESSIFTQTKRADLNKAYPAHKHITDYVFTDGLSEKSTERKFAEQLDAAEEVAVYAKLPRTFKIPTPVGNYSPDWAIAFKRGPVKHIFFIAATKGSMESMELRAVEKAKIDCAKKLFNEMSTSQVRYHEVDSYEELLDVMRGME